MVKLSESLPSTAFTPKRYRPGNIGNWSGHLTFARDLIASLRPSLLVELGTHYGESYFGFCQAIAENGIGCRAYAVDSWVGEEHAGFYDESVYEDVRAYNESNYRAFSYLVRDLFDSALSHFEDDSIDLLHIDGLHSFDAVAHDFYSWLPKVKPGGIVLLHDTAVRRDDFGVWKLWERLANEGATFEFHHSSGLGVFEKSGGRADRCQFVEALFTSDRVAQEHWRRYYFLSALEMECHHRKSADGWTLKESEHVLQVFIPGANGYSEARSSSATIPAGGWEHLTLDVMSGFEEGYIRIDPTNRPCLLELRGVNIRSSVDHQLLWESSSDLAEIEAGGTLMRLKEDDPGNGAALFLSYGFDPQLFLRIPASTLFDQPLQLQIWLRLHATLDKLVATMDATHKPSGAAAQGESLQLSAANEELAATRAELAQVRESFSQANQHWEALRNEDTTRRNKLEAEREELNRRLGEMQRQIDALEMERDHLLKEADVKQTRVYLLSDSHNAMKDAEKEHAKLEEVCRAMEDNYAKLEASYRSLMGDYQGLERTFHDVLNSHSWKVTSPLRAVLRILKPKSD